MNSYNPENKMNRQRSQPKIGLLFIACAVLGGCASANNRYEQLNAHLADGVDCTQAHMQISDLESNKLSTSEKLANSVASVLPTSIVLNLIVGEYKSRTKIASGHYDKQIESRIGHIKQTCMLEESLTPG